MARGSAVQDHVALAEIDLCGELIIAASNTTHERLTTDEIDEVLRVVTPGAGEAPEGRTGDARPV
ncbi:hypothetical protein AB0M28_30850 [Streptomyces sp. NPDC051940]|uniref:hypothetical protein n=1 Tax=Streptomyces sp. NPDC051940 TaxID=3155675 RepID=UPI003422BEFA